MVNSTGLGAGRVLRVLSCLEISVERRERGRDKKLPLGWVSEQELGEIFSGYLGPVANVRGHGGKVQD